MKHKFSKQIMSMLLAFVMVVGLIPASALTAFAASPTEITELSLSFMTQSEIPAVGTLIKNRVNGRLQEDDDRIDLTSIDLIWKIDDSTVTVNPSDFDTGMCFEAGRSYNAEFIVKVVNPNQYTITENTVIKLTDPVDFTYTSKLSNIVETASSFYAYMKLTITMNGERTYPDIDKVLFKDFASPSDGMAKSACGTDIYYSNCQMTSGTWLGEVWGEGDTFVAGETYTYRVVLTAREGYKFDKEATVTLTNGVPKEPSYYAFTDDNRTLTLDYTYTIPSITWVDAVEATIKRYEQTLTPIAGEAANDLFTDTLLVDENAPYEIIGELGRTWYSEDGTELTNNDRFEAGKTYYFDYAYSIKNEYRHLYRFDPDNLTTTITGESYTGKGFQKAERVEDSNLDNTYVKFRYYFTCQYPASVGSSAGNPAFCYSYEEFKFAMENPDIRYVALGNVDDVISKVEGDGLIPAISVNGIKHLNVIGNATFTAPANNDGYKTIVALLHTQQGDTLTVSGAGSLKFRAVSNNSYNSVIYNQGGSVIIDGATLIGSYNTAVYGKAIWQDYGELRISDGQFFAENAMAPGKLPVAHTAVYINGGQAWIQGGTFKTENKIDTIDLPYGLDIGQYATVDLSGGTFYGILLPKSTTPLANYMDEETYSPLSDGSWFNPESEYSQEYVESGKVVRIAWLIDHVDVHINAPIAGVDITENYFNIPTSGCEVTMYYPQWYKNGQPVPYGTFEAGASYKVVVWVDAKADYGAEFTTGVTVAINNQSVAVDRKSSHLIAFEYDFGECPNIVPQVDLTVTAPKEGEYPSYIVGCGSDAYYAVGGSSNYTEYRKWYWSSDNDEWYEMGTLSGGEKMDFWSGYYYKLVVDVRTNNGYEFPTYDNGSSIVPDVSATVNGYYATVIKAYDQDPSRYITVEYNFGECNDSVVENIIVENITAPVAGEKPNYNWSIRGTGYQMDTAKNAYYDAYWKNPPEQWYYIKNGLGWFDLTDFDWVYENETFIPGHEYEVRVYVITEDGFEFAHDKWYAPTVTATVNGKTAEAIVDGSYCAITQQIEYTFTCTQPEINTIMLYNLDAPVAGETPDTEMTAAYPEYYTVTNITWLDEEDNVVNSFEQGRLYTAEITVEAKDYDGVDGCIFADDVTAYIDGKEVTGWTNSVTNVNNTLTVRYSFRNGASAPEVGYSVSGTVTSFNDTEGDITLQLYYGESVNPSYEITVKGNTVNYNFTDVVSGTYTLKVSKANHVTREYTVVVGNSSVLQDVKIHLLGDINGDGRLRSNDLTIAYDHVSGSEIITDDYLLKCADIDGNGRIRSNDVTKMYDHISGDELLW